MRIQNNNAFVPFEFNKIVLFAIDSGIVEFNTLPVAPPCCSAAACAAAQGDGSPAAHLWHPPRRPGTLRGQTPYAPCCAAACGDAAPAAEGPLGVSSAPASPAAPGAAAAAPSLRPAAAPPPGGACAPRCVARAYPLQSVPDLGPPASAAAAREVEVQSTIASFLEFPAIMVVGPRGLSPVSPGVGDQCQAKGLYRSLMPAP
jgi:hypothetical protein